ncbi:MAG: hypothetical protein MZV65_28250 [Chromatiales bacterium]|nr:hypothetical protein [Chromatiales bacterium]
MALQNAGSHPQLIRRKYTVPMLSLRPSKSWKPFWIQPLIAPQSNTLNTIKKAIVSHLLAYDATSLRRFLARIGVR